MYIIYYIILFIQCGNKVTRSVQDLKSLYGGGGQEGSVCMCVCMHVVLGGRKLRELSCLVFVCCTQLPPGCFSRGYGSLSSRWQNSLTQGEVCVLSLCVTNHTHTHSWCFFLRGISRFRLSGVLRIPCEKKLLSYFYSFSCRFFFYQSTLQRNHS